MKGYTIQEIETLSDIYNTLVEFNYWIGTIAMICLIRDAVIDQNLDRPYFEIPSDKTISGDVAIFVLDWDEELIED